MWMMLPSCQITPINFADTFAHSPIRITDRIKNVSHVLVHAFVTQGPTPDSYSCGFAAFAGHADATLRFLQAIEPTHCLNTKSARRHHRRKTGNKIA